MAAVGLVVWFGLASKDEFPNEILQYIGLLMFLGGLAMKRRIGPRRDLYARQAAALRSMKGYVTVMTLLFFYLGIFLSKNWSAESVDFLYRYLPVVVLPAFVYLLVVSFKSDNSIRKQYFKRESETDILEKARKESVKDGRHG